MDYTSIWLFLCAFNQKFPLFFPSAGIFLVCLYIFIFLFFLGIFRIRGHGLRRHGYTLRRSNRLFKRNGRGFALTAYLIRNSSLLWTWWASRFIRAVRAFRILWIFGMPFWVHVPLFFALLTVNTVYTIYIFTNNVIEFVIAYEQMHYVHWDSWTYLGPPRRTDVPWFSDYRLVLFHRRSLEYRWWLKWFWRRSVMGSTYYYGKVRFGRGGKKKGRPIKIKNYKKPKRNLGYWLGVWRYRNPYLPRPNRRKYIRWQLRQQNTRIRYFRYLHGASFVLCWIQSMALIYYALEWPRVNRQMARRPPKVGSDAAKEYGKKLDWYSDFIKKVNLVSLAVFALLVMSLLDWSTVLPHHSSIYLIIFLRGEASSFEIEKKDGNCSTSKF